MKKLCLLTALFAIASASTAYADNDKGLYVGAGVGQFNVKIDNVVDIGPIVGKFDSDDVSFKVFGGWRFSKYIAAELDYIDFGNPSDDVEGFDVEAKLHGVAPYIIGTLPLGPIELFAKAGYFFYDFNTTVSDSLNRTKDSSSDSDFVYGAGIGITLFGHLNARLEYEVIDISDVVDDANALWLTGAWRF